MNRLVILTALASLAVLGGVSGDLEYTNQFSGGYGALLKFNLPSNVDRVVGTFTFDIKPDDFQVRKGLQKI